MLYRTSFPYVKVHDRKIMLFPLLPVRFRNKSFRSGSICLVQGSTYFQEALDVDSPDGNVRM